MPALEFGYNFLAIAHAPQSVIVGRMLPLIEEQLQKLDVAKEKPESYGYQDGKTPGDAGQYWDDIALCRFLKGVCLRYMAYPVRLESNVFTSSC